MDEPPPPHTPAPWRRLSSRPGDDLIVGRARYDRLVNPRTEQPMERIVIELPDWVNVVALTDAGELVLVHQYRFGTQAVSCEIPGGVLETGEDHRAAAERELREETGFTAPTWTYLGQCEPNPAFQDNLCHSWLAEGAERTHPPEPDPGEDITVELVPTEEVRRRVASGELRHSLMLVGLARVLDLRRAPD